MSHKTRSALLGAVFLIPAAGMVLQLPWATALWPFETGRLTYIFLAAMIAATVVTGSYVIAILDRGAIPGGAINLLVMFGGFTLFLGSLALAGEGRLWPYVTGAALIAGSSAIALAWSRGFPFVDQSPVPKPVTWSFGVFVMVLVGAGAALVLKTPDIMPWPIDPNTSVMVGTIFLADAMYFVYGLAKPAWSNARGQLLAFLVYDLVLIVPLLQHFQTVKPGSFVNLVVYVGVVVYSGALAAYYLFLSAHGKAAVSTG